MARWGTTDAVSTGEGAADVTTPRVALATGSLRPGVGVITHPLLNLVASQEVSVPVNALRVLPTIQNTGTDVLVVSEGTNTAAGTVGLVLKVCAAANDGTGGVYETASTAQVWVYRLTNTGPAARAEQQALSPP